jgi:hypothetical protein
VSRRCRDCGQSFEPTRSYHARCWPCWQSEHSQPNREVVRLVPVLDAPTLREAVALAHPDLHPPERRERATRTTAALLTALARTRELERAA